MLENQPARLGVFLNLQSRRQLLQRSHASEIEADHFHGPLVRTPPGVAQEEQGGDERAVDLQGHAALALGQPVAAAQDALEPLEEESRCASGSGR